MARTATHPDATGACCPHSQHVHTHHRPGSDCSLCACPRWRPARATWLARVKMAGRIVVTCAGVLVILACLAVIIASGLSRH